jgi:hypothetical protein
MKPRSCYIFRQDITENNRIGKRLTSITGIAENKFQATVRILKQEKFCFQILSLGCYIQNNIHLKFIISPNHIG